MKLHVIRIFAFLLLLSWTTADAKTSSLPTEQLNPTEICTSEDGPKFWARLRRDLVSAVQGAAVGAAIGGAFGEPAIGAAIGAVVGGIIGSAGGDPLIVPGNPPTSSTLSNMANPTNPYDNIGLSHYEGMDALFANPTGILSAEGVPNTTNYYSWASQFIIGEGLANSEQIQRYYSYSTFLDRHNQASSATDFSTTAGQLQSQQYLTSTEANLLTSYVSTLQNSTSLASFKAYSVQTENGIVNSSAYTEKSKAILLTFMATARYGAGYWGFE